MKDDARFAGPMCSWPEVAAVEGAVAALKVLSTRARCCLATNASASSENDIWRALALVGLDRYIDTVFCFQTLGVAKPARAFFNRIQEVIGLPAAAIVMVGDSYDTDVKGALNAGMRACWYNPLTDETRNEHGVITIHKLEELIDTSQLAKFS